MADRFTHLGTIGLTIAVVWTAVDWAGSDPRRRKLAGWAAGAVILALSVLTVRQIGFWRTPRRSLRTPSRSKTAPSSAPISRRR